MSPRLRVGGRSDVGMQRHNNQDSMYAGAHLIAVADGVGGAAGGEVASRLTIEALASLDTDEISDPQAAFRTAAEAADAAIRQTVAGDPSLAGMSTTLTAMLATDTELVMAHIGDSRAYRLRGGVLSQITHDHTLVQSLIDEGQITETEALTHPRRSWIMRALDGRGEPDLDLVTIDVEPGDRLLVCSDGLSSYVSAADITAALAGADPQGAADRLIDLALRADAPDNVSCVVADPVDGELAEQPPILGGAVAEVSPASQTMPVEAAPQDSARPATTHRQPKHRGIGRRLAIVAGLVVILIAAVVAGVGIYIHHQWYVAPANGKVGIYRGVQGKAAGIHLSHLQTVTNIPVTALPQDDRDEVTSGITKSSQAGASDVVTNLRQQACASPTPTPSPSPTPTPKRTSKAAASHPKRTTTPAPVVPVWCAGASASAP